LIRAWVADAAEVHAADATEAQRALQESSCAVWLDFEGSSEADVHRTLEPLGVHPLVLEDMVMEVNRPKVDDYGRYLCLVVHSARWDEMEKRPVLREIDLVLGERALVTYHDGETRSVVAARDILLRRPELLTRGPASLMHFLLDTLVDHYLPIMDQIAEEVDALEELVFEHDASEVQMRIVRLKRGIAAMRRIVGPQRDTILALTRDEFRTIPAEMRPYLRDVYDRLARVTDLLDSFRDEVASLLDLHVSVTSNRMNAVIKRLTVIATVGLPLTVVTSFYGMNLKLAEYEWRHGEWFVLGLLAATALGTWAYLKMRRWD
jgi:magnesium transporter